MKTITISMVVALLILAQSMTASAQTTVYIPFVAGGDRNQQLIEFDSMETGEAALKLLNLSEDDYQKFHDQLQQMFNKSNAASQSDQNVHPAQADTPNGVISRNLNCPVGKGAAVWFSTGPGWVTAQFYRTPVDSPPMFRACNAVVCNYMHGIGGLSGNSVLMHIVSSQFTAAYTLTACVA